MILKAKELIGQGRVTEALALMRAEVQPDEAFSRQSLYARLAKSMAKHIQEFPILRLALLSGSTLDHWVDTLRFWLLLEGFQLEPYIAPFNVWRQEALDSKSGLYEFKPDFVWFFLTQRDLNFNAVPVVADDPDEQAAAMAKGMVSMIEQVRLHSTATVVVNNAEALTLRVLSNYEGHLTSARANLIRRYNLALADKIPSGCVLFDLDYQAACYGLQRWEDARMWYHSKHPFSLNATGPVAFSAAKLLSASQGRAKKCVVLDLDNTLWGGVVGDDGPDGIRIGSSGGAVGEAFADFQGFLKCLSLRGIALAVCSKNEEANAREPFESRSEMRLSLDDFAVFKANWVNKADNIRGIATEMNLGLDSFVFVDDNPVECELVRTELPQVAVVELPQDPSDYIQTLTSGMWFETLTFSEEDRFRSQAYKENAVRSIAQAQMTNMDDYLRSLEMSAKWGAADKVTIPRLHQLVNKTNQFHLTTTRYSETGLAHLATSSDAWLGWFSLKDRFGDHGVIAIVILRFKDETAIVDTWAMSCRVFSRGMEDFVFSIIRKVAIGHGCHRLKGHYLPTAKNVIVSELYSRWGGRSQEVPSPGRCWLFELNEIAGGNESFIRDESSDNLTDVKADAEI